MEAPLGITFFKKVELYQHIKQWDDQFKKLSAKKSRAEATWGIEKKVITWIYFGHKNLGSPIISAHFEANSPRSKIKDFNFSDSELKSLEKINRTRLFENFAMRGYAHHKEEPDELYFNSDALLTSTVLYEINKSFLKRASYEVWSLMWGHLGAFLLLVLFVSALIENQVLNKLKDVIINFLTLIFKYLLLVKPLITK